MTKPIVFLGPSMPRKTAQTLFDADYRAPVAQGDLVRAVNEKPPAIAIIDGIFRDAPTVRHREILWALSHGIPVYGAASMGALRAAELHRFGMVGVGLIYRWYRRYALLPEDAVAVTHGPAALGSPPLSHALVDIRRTLQHARRQGALSHDAACQTLADITAQAFPNRRLPENLMPYLVLQKTRDAEALLIHLADRQTSGVWPVPKTDPPPIVHAWLDDLADSGLPRLK